MSEPLIREATVADRRAIHDVTLAAYEEYAAGMPPALWRGYRSNIVATLADPAPALQLVAHAGGEVVGAVLLYPAVAVGGGATAGPPGGPLGGRAGAGGRA